MNEVTEILTTVGAIISEGHFVGTSGLHFDTYVNKDFLYPHTKETSRVCELFAEKYKDAGVEVVVGPALGGIILSQWTASSLSKLTGREVLGVYTEKTPDGGQAFTRGYDKYVKGKKVLIVEDIVTTGGSILKVINAVKDAGGEIVGTSSIINKTENLDKGMFGVPFEALSNLFIKTYNKEECPLCQSGVPINTEFGHGKKFLDLNK